jgi:spermidine synthase
LFIRINLWHAYCIVKYIRQKAFNVKRGRTLPVPEVKKGKWSKERERTKSGRWRKKRSDADQPRKKKRSTLKYALAAIAVVIVALIVIYFLFPDLFSWLKI